MARFRLTQKHYLNSPSGEWLWQETQQVTGKVNRKIFNVPVHLDPDQPGDHNYPGEIIVSTKEDPRYPRDIIFRGPPTPDMIALDEEAEALLAQWASKWVHPIEGLDGGFGKAVEEALGQQLVQAKVSATAQADRVAALETEIAELRKALGGKAKPPSLQLGV